MINDFDQANQDDSITRMQVEHLIYEASSKFMVNKNFSVHSKEFETINTLNGDTAYHRYLMLCKVAYARVPHVLIQHLCCNTFLLCKVYISLCQINKSVEVDYYKIRCNKDFRIVIPRSYSKTTSDYLDAITKKHNFSERNGVIFHDHFPLFDLRGPDNGQPDIHLSVCCHLFSTLLRSHTATATLIL